MQGTVKRADHFISLELSLVPEKEFYVLSWLVQSFRYGTFCILQKNIRQFIFRKTSKCCGIRKDWTRGSVILSKPPVSLKMFVLGERIFEAFAWKCHEHRQLPSVGGTTHWKRHPQNAIEQMEKIGWQEDCLLMETWWAQVRDICNFNWNDVCYDTWSHNTHTHTQYYHLML